MDYQKNLEAFYRRDDFDACTGAFKRDIQTMQFNRSRIFPDVQACCLVQWRTWYGKTNRR